jgi:hypothetical protein
LPLLLLLLLLLLPSLLLVLHILGAARARKSGARAERVRVVVVAAC